MTDWEFFCECVPWFLTSDSKVDISSNSERVLLSDSLSRQFPKLSNLLDNSNVTSLEIDGLKHQLLTWETDNGERMGWLCIAVCSNVIPNLFRTHTDLLNYWGGIVEIFNEPEDTWLLNHNDILTLDEARNGADFIEDYKWAFEDEGFVIPINLEDYYCVAREANGNTTICHRQTGDILLFAPDHSFDHLICLEKCPEYTLYKIRNANTFQDWIEEIAQQWLVFIKPV